MKKSITIMCLVVVCRLSFGIGNEGYVSYGALSGGLGDASVAIIDGWSCINNQGALAFVDGFTLGVGYDLKYGLKEFSTRTLVAAYPMDDGILSMQFSAFGSSLFAVYKTGFGYSRVFGDRFGAGLHFDLMSVKMNPQERALIIPGVELGCAWKLKDDFVLGFHLFNPTAVRYDKGSYNERLPVEYRFGFHYQMATKINLNTEVAGNDRDKPFLRFGIEYRPVSSLGVNLGFQSKAAAPGGGVAYEFERWEVSVSCRSMQRIGRIYSISFMRKL